MPHVLVAGPLHASGLALLEDAPGLTFSCQNDPDECGYSAQISEADALIIRTQPMQEATIAKAERLRIVSRHGVGYDAVDAKALAQRNIPLTIVGDVNSGGVAEHALGLIFALVKQVCTADRAVRSGDWSWRNQLGAGQITGKRVLILGFGRIGRKLAQLLSGFDLAIAAYDPFIARGTWPEGRVERFDDLSDALGWADIVSVHLPKTEGAILGADEIAMMQPHALLINTARGGLIDERALHDALINKGLAGAGLDVFEEEPPQISNPLLALETVILSPHMAGITREGAELLAIKSVQNVLDFFANALDPNLVVNGVTLSGPGQSQTI